MSIRSLESAICWELREVTGVRNLRVKDIREWSTGKVEPRDGEVVFSLPINAINAAVLVSALGKKWPRPTHQQLMVYTVECDAESYRGATKRGHMLRHSYRPGDSYSLCGRIAEDHLVADIAVLNSAPTCKRCLALDKRFPVNPLTVPPSTVREKSNGK